jgi:hypothetical protein
LIKFKPVWGVRLCVMARALRRASAGSIMWILIKWTLMTEYSYIGRAHREQINMTFSVAWECRLRMCFCRLVFCL